MTIPDAEREERDYRTNLELREAGATGGRPYRYLEGRAVPYDVWAELGWFLEQHAYGSLEATTKRGSGTRLPLMLFHDRQTFPIGHAESWRSERDGLYGVWKLNGEARSQTAAEMANAGDLVGMSIGFQPIHSKWDYLDERDWNPALGPDHMDKVTRTESRLLEVSLTPTPAFELAEVQCVRDVACRRTAYSRGAVPPPARRELDAWIAELDGLKSA